MVFVSRDGAFFVSPFFWFLEMVLQQNVSLGGLSMCFAYGMCVTRLTSRGQAIMDTSAKGSYSLGRRHTNKLAPVVILVP